MKNDIQQEPKALDLSIKKIDLSDVSLSHDNSKAHGH